MRLATERALLDRAAAHIAAGSTDMAPHALEIAAAHYAANDVQDEEVALWFRRGPQLVAVAPDLPNAGSYLTHDLLGTPLLLVRGDDGVVRAFVNACRHRGARIADGRGEARSFSCPFHAWNYARDGRLLAQPNSLGGFAPCSDVDLRPVAVLERAGLIFVQLEGDDIAARTDALLAGCADEIANYDFAAHAYFGSRHIRRACNYKLVIDTFTEAYHIAALHKQSIRPYYYSAPALTDRFGPITRMIGVRASIDRELERPRDEQRFVRHGTIQYLLPPNIVLTHQVDHLQLWQVYPVPGDPGACDVHLHLYWPRPLDDDAVRKSTFNLDVLWRVTNDEDFPQCEAAQRALASGALPHIVFGRNEPGGVYYHEAVDAPMSRRSVRALAS